MSYKEKIFNLFDALDENDQKSAYEMIHSLAHMNRDQSEEEGAVNILGSRFFVVPD